MLAHRAHKATDEERPNKKNLRFSLEASLCHFDSESHLAVGIKHVPQALSIVSLHEAWAKSVSLAWETDTIC